MLSYFQTKSPIRFFALLSLVTLTVAIPSKALAEEVRLLSNPEFVYSSKLSDIKNPLKALTTPERKDFQLSYEFEIQVAKPFKEIRNADFENTSLLKTLTGAQQITEVPNLPNLTWKLVKSVKKMGITMDVEFTLEQAVIRGTDDRASLRASAWIQKNFGAGMSIIVAADEIVVIQKLSNFDKIFAEGASLIRIRQINHNYISVKSQSLVVIRKSAHNKLQAATFFRTESTFEEALREQLNAAMATIPQIW